MERKLAAILYADVAGYSRLTGADEEGTHEALSASLDLFATAIEDHQGRVVHYAGDAVLAEFGSVLAALTCAVQVQRALGARNEGVADDKKLQYRIGINLGEVIVDRDDIYGDGVNVAARLESLADAGGICISASVHDQVKRRMDVGFEEMGEQSVKNIVEPVRAFRAVLGGQAVLPARRRKPRTPTRWWWAAAAAVVVTIAAGAAGHLGLFPQGRETPEARMEALSPDRPSIAVLPFENLSDDTEQGYFADGITEEIITTLSKIPEMFVIARNSTYTYKGKAVRIQQVARELGVRYVLEGSVRRAGDRIRITTQLIDAASEHHVWADSYDRQLRDLFDVQDEITREIVTALQVKLTEGEQARVWRKHTRNLEAWEYMIQGVARLHHLSKVDNAMARRLFEKAVEVDRGYALAYAMVAWTHWVDVQNGWATERSFERAAELAERARALDDELPDVYALQGAVHLYRREYDQAVAAAEKAVTLNSNHATNTAILAFIENYAGQPQSAISHMKTAMRLSPYYPAWFVQALGSAYLGADDFEAALAASTEFIGRAGSPTQAARGLIIRAEALAGLGRADEAGAEIAKALDLDPGVVAAYRRGFALYRDREATTTRLGTLRRLGLPE